MTSSGVRPDFGTFSIRNDQRGELFFPSLGPRYATTQSSTDSIREFLSRLMSSLLPATQRRPSPGSPRPPVGSPSTKGSAGQGGGLGKAVLVGGAGLGLLGVGAVFGIVLLIGLFAFFFDDPEPERQSPPEAGEVIPAVVTPEAREFAPAATAAAAGCPYDPAGFALVVGAQYGPFQDADGFVYAFGFTGSEFGVQPAYMPPERFSANINPNGWLPLDGTPFYVCRDSMNNQYYAVFDPYW